MCQHATLGLREIKDVVERGMRIGDYDLQKTCDGCPEQYDVYKGTEQVGYLRLRHGLFTARYPDVEGKVVFSSNPRGDGEFEDEERINHLVAAIQSIDDEVQKRERLCRD